MTQRDLPAGWAFSTVGGSCVVNPRTFLEPVEEDCPVSFVPMAAVEAKRGQIDLSQVKPYGQVNKGYTRFAEGDVLFAKITPCMENGKVAVAKDLTNGCGCGSTEFHILRPYDGLSRDFLNFYLLQDAFRREAQRNMAGTAGQLRVPASWLTEAPIPLPPLAEQRRIVAEIETQFTRLDATVAALRRGAGQPDALPGQCPQGCLRGAAGPHRGGTGPLRRPRVRTRRRSAGAHSGRAPRPLGVSGDEAGQVQGTFRPRHLRTAGTARWVDVGKFGAVGDRN